MADRFAGVWNDLNAAIVPKLDHRVVFDAGHFEAWEAVLFQPVLDRQANDAALVFIPRRDAGGEDFYAIALFDPALHPLDHGGNWRADVRRPLPTFVVGKRPVEVDADPS